MMMSTKRGMSSKRKRGLKEEKEGCTARPVCTSSLLLYQTHASSEIIRLLGQLLLTSPSSDQAISIRLKISVQSRSSFRLKQ